MPSLKLFGDVDHYDWFDKLESPSREKRQTLRSDMNKDLLAWIKSHVAKKQIDLIFFYISGEQILPETLKEIKKYKIPLVNMSLNDKEYFVGRVDDSLASGVRDICPHIDLNWTSTKDAVPKYLVEGALPIYLPEGANPVVHRPYDVEREYDVTFVGQRYGNRPETIDFLRNSGIRIEPFGHGWPNGSLSTEEMVKMYSRSKITLGFSGISGYKDTFHLKGRDFEVPMSGGLYLTEFHPELIPYFDVETEIATYTDKDTLLEKIKYLLANPEEAEKIRRNGHLRAKSCHTWEMRFSHIFNLFNL